MERESLKLYPFSDIYVYVDRENKKITLYVLDKDKKTAYTIEDLKNDKKGYSLLDVRPDVILSKKYKIEDEYQKLLDAENKKPRNTYKQRINAITQKRDMEIKKFLLKYRYVLNSPELDVCAVKQTYPDFDPEWGGSKTAIEVNYFYQNLDKSVPDEVDFVIEGKNNILLQNLSKFKTEYEIKYLTDHYNITSIENLTKLQESVQYSVFDYKNEKESDFEM